jgi:hypothetical protein
MDLENIFSKANIEDFLVTDLKNITNSDKDIIDFIRYINENQYDEEQETHARLLFDGELRVRARIDMTTGFETYMAGLLLSDYRPVGGLKLKEVSQDPSFHARVIPKHDDQSKIYSQERWSFIDKHRTHHSNGRTLNIRTNGTSTIIDAHPQTKIYAIETVTKKEAVLKRDSHFWNQFKSQYDLVMMPIDSNKAGQKVYPWPWYSAVDRGSKAEFTIGSKRKYDVVGISFNNPIKEADLIQKLGDLYTSKHHVHGPKTLPTPNSDKSIESASFTIYRREDVPKYISALIELARV